MTSTMTSTKIEWVPAVSSYVQMPVGYAPEDVTAEDVANDDALRAVGVDAVLLTTAKGECVGTIAEACAWQAEHQGAMARVEACGVTVDIDDVEFGAPDDGEAVLRRIAEELDGMTVATARHIRGEDADAGLVLDVVDARTGTVRVGWATGTRTEIDVLSLRAV
jgi:hypothetical protein